LLRVCNLPILGMSLLVIKMIKINFVLKSHDFSISVLVKWILSVCNIRSIKLSVISKKPIGFHNEIGLLKKLKELYVSVDKASKLEEVRLIAF
jgi:hypothetical protein